MNKDDLIECIVSSKIGILSEKGGTVENLLRKEISTKDFPKLMSQFIGFGELQALLSKEKQVGGEIKRPELSFQRTITWLLSVLGFQVVELEGTQYKEVVETDGTRRETDMLTYDPETKKMCVIDVTLRTPSDKKIDDIANLQLALQRKEVFVEPMIIVAELATETKKNVRGVKVIDYEDLKSILDKIQMGNIEIAKRIITG